MTLLSKFNYVTYLLNAIPSLINSVKINKKIIEISVSPKNLNKVLFFFKNNNKSQFKQLIDICAIDFLGKDSKRFTLVYNLLSPHWNSRIFIRTSLNDLDSIKSATNVFKSADWLEREVWDTFGIFFEKHPDLRRILTDYGFEGFPFRKDFPQTGFIEVRYDSQKKHVLYEPVEFAQEYRFFNYNNPWLQLK